MDMVKQIGFGELIKTYRKSKKMSQAEMGQRIGRNQVTISHYEKNVHFPNNADEIKRIAALINQPVSYLVDAIEYAKNGIVKQHEALFIDLDSLSEEDLIKKYKFVSKGEEITGEELKKMLKQLEFERFVKANEN